MWLGLGMISNNNHFSNSRMASFLRNVSTLLIIHSRSYFRLTLQLKDSAQCWLRISKEKNIRSDTSVLNRILHSETMPHPSSNVQQSSGQSNNSTTCFEIDDSQLSLITRLLNGFPRRIHRTSDSCDPSSTSASSAMTSFIDRVKPTPMPMLSLVAHSLYNHLPQ